MQRYYFFRLTSGIKFSREDKPVNLSVKNDDAILQIVVTDKGLGIPEEDLPHLFTSFYRGKNVTNIQGSWVADCKALP